MSTGPGGPERGAGVVQAESEPKQDSLLRVYPVGFTASVKTELVENLKARRLLETTASELQEALSGAIRGFSTDTLDLKEFLEVLRRLGQYVDETGKATETELDFINHVLRTDEEIAVGLARVSRSSASVEEGMRTVTEDGASKFHSRWTVSSEGYGHASVAEHAIIHLAVENIPSLDGDILTDNRLGSYTEFSARFRGRQGLNYHEPESVARDSRLSKRWHEVHQMLFSLNSRLMDMGLAYVQTNEAQVRQPQRRVFTADGKVIAKLVADQFKDLMPASRHTNIGVTINAREAENIIRKMLSLPYPSVNALGQAIKEQSFRVIPTLVKYADRSEYMVAAREGISQLVRKKIIHPENRHPQYPSHIKQGRVVDIVHWDEDADAKFLAGALFRDPRTGSYRQLLEEARHMLSDDKEKEITKLLGSLGRHDVAIRALELPGDWVVEYPGMTYGVWREYKRHRMQYYDAKDLDVRFGYMLPPLAYEMDESNDPQFHGCIEAMKRALDEVGKLFTEVSIVDPYAAQYCVTRFHIRPALAKFNNREAFHLLNLRTGSTAYPPIRQLMWPLLDEMVKRSPLIMNHLRMKIDKTNRPDREHVWST